MIGKHNSSDTDGNDNTTVIGIEYRSNSTDDNQMAISITNGEQHSSSAKNSIHKNKQKKSTSIFSCFCCAKSDNESGSGNQVI